MVRFLQSTWMSMLLGGLIFLSTTAALLKPSQLPAPAPAPIVEIARPGSNEPSWKFRNPEMDQWIQEIQREKEALNTREQQLKDLETRLHAERQELSVVTQAVYQMQSDFDKNVVRLNAQDADNLKRQAKLLSAMSPEGAAATLNEMGDDDVVRILFTMKADDASVVLDTLSKAGKDQAKRAATIIERMRRTLPPTTTTTALQK
jgi:flagellar motility protein MotE (MotC chaperone)